MQNTTTMASYQPDQFEKEIIEYWKSIHAFAKSVEDKPADKPYVFYDGPPFATGLPHYGHILASTIKDLIPRYYTMKGYQVRRRWGWDCHGLPIENIVEQKLHISGKKEIEKKGVDVFNAEAKNSVLTYAHEWGKMVERVGRWVDFEHSYKTMDSTYMESIWWALKQLWDKQLIYEGRKVLLFCPRCETPVSKFEVAMDNSYQDVAEESVYVKFRIQNQTSKIKHPDSKNHRSIILPEHTFILAWTTTPWTLPANVALAVGEKIEYVLTKQNDEHYILARDQVDVLEGEYEVLDSFKGKELVGIEYEPLYTIAAIAAQEKKFHYVTSADFVTTTEGTGVVHTAVVYGENDYELGLEQDLPIVPILDSQGKFIPGTPALIEGLYFKDAERPIKKDLEARGVLYRREQQTHPYPFCWRCNTTLFYNAIPAWFINLQKVKKRMLELNEKIHWYPDHLQHGRFGNGIETAPDWNISRNRYWATPLPFWKCTSENCKEMLCIGSLQELITQSLNYDSIYSSKDIRHIDLHRPFIDDILLKCPSCKGEMRRIPEVIDCWVESGSMPFAEFHYPFENKKEFESRFPAQFVAEYIAQTRTWFFFMLAMSTMLFDTAPFEHVVTTGNILNEKGEKLSKSKKNYPDPWLLIERYGVDALRYYLMSSVVMQADDLFFSEREVDEVYKKVILILWNVFSFYEMYAKELPNAAEDKAPRPTHVLDRWILARLTELIQEVTKQLDAYNTVRALRPIREFIDDLSTWYLRRSRDRLKGTNELDKARALSTLRFVLLTLSKLIAPCMPFISENIYQKIHPHEKESVHFEDWPRVETSLMNTAVLSDMQQVRKVVEFGLALRAEAKIKVRQPLLELRIVNQELGNEYCSLIADELNVKKVTIGQPDGEGWLTKEEGNLKVCLSTVITKELKEEGMVREIIRQINELRKKQQLTIQDRIVVQYSTSVVIQKIVNQYRDQLQSGVLADTFVHTEVLQGEGCAVDGESIILTISLV